MNDFLIYGGMYCLSFLCFFIGDHLNNKNKYIRNLIYFAGCLAPCILAAMRSIDVGGDVKVYVTPEFSRAYNSNLFDFCGSSLYNEFLFSVLIWICSNFFNINFLFFIIQVLVVFPVFFAVKEYNKQICLPMMVFLIFFFNMSLGVMRQCIAMGLYLLSYCHFQKREYKKTIILLIIAFLFHKSVVIILAITILCLYIKSKNCTRKSTLIIVLLAIVFLFSDKIIWLIYPLMRYVSGRYMYYIEQLTLTSKDYSQIPATDFICKMGVIMVCYFLISMKKKWNQNNFFLFFLTLVGRFFILFCANFLEALRLAFYFDYFIFLLCSETFSFKFKRGNKIVFSLLTILIASLYWVYFVYGKQAYETVPFEFFW